MNAYRLSLSLILSCCILLLPATTLAQDVPMTVIKTTGSSTVKVKPTTVRFGIHKTIQEESLENALLHAFNLEKLLREALTELSLQPTVITVNSPKIISIKDGMIAIDHSIEFNVVGLMQTDEAGHPFGRLCDNLLAIAENLEADFSDPEFLSGEKKINETQAIQEATQNAYPMALSIADSLGSAIYAVDTVELKSVRWNVNEDNLPVPASLGEIVCVAQVEVSYALSN